MGANVLGSRSHAGQSQMAIAVPSLENIRINSGAVVTDAHPQFIRLIVQFSFNRAGRGMPKRIANSFLPYPGQFFENNRMQWANHSIYGYREIAGTALSHLFSIVSQCGWQILQSRSCGV
jgi:hypothetical protein